MYYSMRQEIYEITPEQFPALLREIDDPPTRLFVRGTLPRSDAKLLCVVGSRSYSHYGHDVCQKLIGGLARQTQRRRSDGSSRIVIVSGLALGIDALAHQSAVDSGLVTIAWPGSGLDDQVLYPRANQKLAQKIIAAGGALLSEFLPDQRARPESFPQRNRLMAGMSHAVLIIEAEQKSGTMITARLATDYNRDVLTVPGSIFSQHTAGPHYLLAQGARLVTSAADIIDALDLAPPPQPPPHPHTNTKKNSTKTLELFAVKDSIALAGRFPTATPDERAILAVLIERGPIRTDELIEYAALSTSRGNIAITLLEVSDTIKISGGLVYLA